MYTWHHGLWMYFFSRRHPDVWQFVAGSMAPDYIYVIFVAIMLLKGQIAWYELPKLNPTVLMSFLPLYPWVVKVDLIGHSVVIWSVALMLALLPGIRKMQAFVIGWGSHLLLDELTHAAHANFFLYPLSLFSVHSPVSYWEPGYFAREFKLVNGILLGLALIYLAGHWWKKRRQ
ncbi:phospholipase c/d [Lucifera butyrica]|uniref:Phospholipase c/d n=1 Tax=Lucifera butyrica TaxID=1351585 RepID=A0A498RAN7_9FIRM|nr:zinc dependent phospholipase C family protein [Lucifera butyrica]VBB08491.1 phospholipase c/d [Lucifera butyrica]